MTHETDIVEMPEPLESVELWAFGHHFRHYPNYLVANLLSIQSEGAVYSHFVDESVPPDAEGLRNFKYYKIKLTPQEIFGYVEACIAYEKFYIASLHRESFEDCVRAIGDPAIEQRVLEYDGGIELEDGTFESIAGCHASFYPEGMEALLCGAVPDRYELLTTLADGQDSFALLMQLINNFPLCCRLLLQRQRNRPPFQITNEYDAQDLLYVVIRSLFDDARREEWTPSRWFSQANGYNNFFNSLCYRSKVRSRRST